MSGDTDLSNQDHTAAAAPTRATRQRQALLVLSTLKIRDPIGTCKEIVRAGADALETERAGVWLLDEPRTGVRSAALYQRSTATFLPEREQHLAEHPDFFAALLRDN